MPYYADLRKPGVGESTEAGAARERTIDRLLELRQALSTEGPPQRSFGTLLLATWNIREFDSAKWGQRLPEAFSYIAEIVDRFDLVAIQEVREDLAALQRLLDRLGPNWGYIVSDVTAGTAGNEERLAFVYDRRKVRFLGVAGELVLPPVQQKGGSTVPAAQVARTPLMAAFQVGWTKFLLTTVHIVYGGDSREPAARVEEIQQVAGFLRKRADAATDLTGDMLLLGDFNIYTAGDATMKALTTEGGFTIPRGIADLSGSNIGEDRKYDQIAYRARPARFQATERAGVFDYYRHVFTDEDADVYRPAIDAYIQQQHAAGKQTPEQPTTPAAGRSQYLAWRTFQMSDHLPLWAEFRVDFSDDYLHEIRG